MSIRSGLSDTHQLGRLMALDFVQDKQSAFAIDTGRATYLLRLPPFLVSILNDSETLLAHPSHSC